MNLARTIFALLIALSITLAPVGVRAASSVVTGVDVHSKPMQPSAGMLDCEKNAQFPDHDDSTERGCCDIDDGCQSTLCLNISLKVAAGMAMQFESWPLFIAADLVPAEQRELRDRLSSPEFRPPRF